MILLPTATIAAAAAGVLGPEQKLVRLARHVMFVATFVYGAGGTSTKAWVQTKVGLLWRDVACFAFTTAAATKIAAIAPLSITTVVAASDAALADDTAVAGLIGSAFRVKYTSTGTYSGATSLHVAAQVWE